MKASEYDRLCDSVEAFLRVWDKPSDRKFHTKLGKRIDALRGHVERRNREPGSCLPPATSAGQGEPHQFDPEPAPNETPKEWLARLLREGCGPMEWDRLWRAWEAKR